LFAPAAILLIHKYRYRRWFLVALSGIFLASIIIFFPWILTFYNASLDFFGGWASDIEKPGIRSILVRLTNFTAYWPLGSLESNLAIKFYKAYSLLLTLVLILSIFIKRQKVGVYYLAMFLLVPASLLMLISWTFSPVWLPRYLLIVAPYLLLLVAAGFTAIQEWQSKIAVFIAIVYFVAVGLGLHAYYTKQFRDDWRGVAEYISQQDISGDMILLATSISRPSSFLSHYYDGPAPIYVVDPSDQNAVFPEFQGRLWVVHKPRNSQEPEAEAFRQEILSNYQVENSKEFLDESGWNEIIEVFLIKE
jgi:hypothetical protein